MSGLLAEFATEAAMEQAAACLRSLPLDDVETHSPVAPQGDGPASVLPTVILFAGLLAGAATFAMQWYADAVSYPMNVGGRPDFSWPAYVPMTFEFGVLAAVGAGVVGFLAVNRLPYLYDPIDEVDAFRRVSGDGWFVAMRSGDGELLGRAREVMGPLEPVAVSELPA